MIQHNDQQHQLQLPEHLFPEFKDKSNWRNKYITVIGRILESGNSSDWAAIVRFYGYDFITDVLRHELLHLSIDAIEDACKYFNLKPAELISFRNKPVKNKRRINQLTHFLETA